MSHKSVPDHSRRILKVGAIIIESGRFCARTAMVIRMLSGAQRLSTYSGSRACSSRPYRPPPYTPSWRTW